MDSLTVKLLGRKISYLVLKKKLDAMWARKGSINVVDLGQDYFLFKFYVDEDLDFVMDGSPWKFFYYYLAIRWVEPEFNPLHATIDKIATWVHLPGVAIEYYNKDIVGKIDNIIGKLLKVDLNTDNHSRGKYARLCVEVDLYKPLVSRYMVNGKLYYVEYEGLHLVCFNCGHVVHEQTIYPKKKG